MDITTVFGTVIEGSNPPESTTSLRVGLSPDVIWAWGIRSPIERPLWADPIGVLNE